MSAAISLRTSPSTSLAVVTSSPRRVSYTISFGAHPWFVLDTNTWRRKKPNPSASESNASTKAPPSTDKSLVPSNGNNTIDDHDEDLEVEDLADGNFEVDLHDLGISAEDIQVMKRIDTRLSECIRQSQQAQAGPSIAPAATRAKGKGHELTAEELEEQLNKLKEQELRYKAMRQSLRDRLIMMKPLRQDPRPVQ